MKSRIDDRIQRTQTTGVDAFATSASNHLFVRQCINDGAVKHWGAYNNPTCWQVDSGRQSRRRNKDTQRTVTKRTLDHVTLIKR